MRTDTKRRLHLAPTGALVAGSLIGTASVLSQLTPKNLRAMDLLEVRLDTFPFFSSPLTDSLTLAKSLLYDIRLRTRLPLLLTFRHWTEAGANPKKSLVKDGARLALIKNLLPFVDGIDVEIRRKKEARLLTKQARNAGVFVIHSVHFFSNAGSMPVFKKLARLSVRMGGDFFKVAVNPSNERQVERFLFEGATLPHPNKILIAMGKTGLVSRFLGPTFGSRVTYGHLGRAAAPGQVPVVDLKKSLQKIYAGPKRK